MDTVLNFCNLGLKEFTSVASTQSKGSWLHLFVSRSEKKWSLQSLLERRRFYGFVRQLLLVLVCVCVYAEVIKHVCRQRWMTLVIL